MCHIKLGQWSSVIDDCQTAIQIDPAGVKAHFYIGQAYTELGNYDRAIEAFETGEGGREGGREREGEREIEGGRERERERRTSSYKVHVFDYLLAHVR